MSKILPFLFTKIEQNWLKYETTLLTAAPPDHYAHLVKVAIETLAAYIEWVPASFVDVGCLVKLTPLLSDVNFRLSVCELLTLVATRSANKHNAPANANEYLFGCVQHICKAMSVQFGTEKDYPFHQKLGEFLCTYGSNHLNSLTNGRLPKNYSTFQSLMIAFINYPGFVVAEIVMPYWLLFSKKLASGNIGAHQDVLPQLLTSFSCKMVRVYDLDTSSIPAETVHFLRTDFQDIKEMKTFFGNLRAKMGFCLKTLAPIRATQIFSHLIETLKNYINKPLSVKNLRATFESVVYFLRALMIGTLRDVILNDSDMLEKVSQFYQLFVNVPYTDPQALAHLFDGIESLVVYLEINPTVIEPLVQKIVQLVLQPHAGDTTTNDVRELRRKALQTLSALFTRLASHVLIILPQLVDLFSRHQASMFFGERVLFMEALATVGNEISGENELDMFVSGLLTSITQTWTKPEFTEAIQTPITLFKILRVQNQQFSINHMLMAYYGVLRRTPNSKHIRIFEQILPNLFVLIRSLHGMWEPSQRQQFPEELQWIFLPLKEPLSEDIREEESTSTSDNRFLSNFNNLHVFAYQVLSLTCCHLHKLPNSTNAIMSYILYHFEVLGDHRLRALLRHFLPSFFRDCESQDYETKILPVVWWLIGSLLNRLQSRWIVIIQRSIPSESGQVSSSSSNSELKQEISEDTIVRDLTRDFGKFLTSSLFEISDNVNISQPSPLCSFLLARPEMWEVLSKVLHCLISWPDSESYQKITSYLKRLVPHLLKVVTFDQFLNSGIMDGLLFSQLREIAQETNNHGINLIYEIMTIAAKHPTLQQAFSRLPGATPQNLTELFKGFDSWVEHSRKAALRKFFMEVTKACRGDWKAKIPPLPERVEVMKPAVTSSNGDLLSTNAQLCLDHLFQS